MREIDIEDLNSKAEFMLNQKIPKPSKEDVDKYEALVKAILDNKGQMTMSQFDRLKGKHKFNKKHYFLFHVYQELIKEGRVAPENEMFLRKTLQIKALKSWSGITSVTIFTSPYPEYTSDLGEKIKQEFSCAYNCSFCPKQPGQPRSYLLNEPGVLRANRNGFDCVKQMHDRMNTLYTIGHPELGKLEVLVLGGTFASYPTKYREEFTRDVYYAANTFWEEPRDRLTLQEEKKLNKTARSRVIGLTFETRPDTITKEEIKLYRKLGCTRLQLGIQHIDDGVLEKNNRKCKHELTVKALKLLKENCYKIDGHFMPNMPFSNPEKDRYMLVDRLVGTNKPVLHEVKKIYNTRYWYEYFTGKSNHTYEYWEHYYLSDPDIQVDQLKIYPTATTVYTDIEKWYKEGSYVPYDESLLVDMILDFKTLMFPWIRINRIVRDFFADTIYSESGSQLNLRHNLHGLLAKLGYNCKCIRCREIKNKEWDGQYVLRVRKYIAQDGDEYFVAAESKDAQTLYGFVRLRLDKACGKLFDELNGAALVREVHVYSQLTNVGEKGNYVQHRGIGSHLMRVAERIASENKYRKIAVISGIGAQTFYEKVGYYLDDNDGEFMIKNL